MKRIVCGILCIVIMVLTVPCAAAALRPAVKFETGTVIEGMFPVYFYLLDCRKLTAGDVVISFDAKALQYEYCEPGKDMLEVRNTTNEIINYDVNPSSKAGLRLSFYFGTSLLSADEYAETAKKGGTVKVNSDKFQLFAIWFSVPENAPDAAKIAANARLMIKGIEKTYTSELSFKPSELPVYVPIRGDIDLDGVVTAMDARLALRCAVKLETLMGIHFKNADMDKDGVITSSDARRILRIAVKLPEE